MSQQQSHSRREAAHRDADSSTGVSNTTRDERRDSTHETVCSECGGQLARDERRGERACTDCGLVVDEDHIDRGPEWREFMDDSENKGRVGAPLTELHHDRGLSTKIGWQNKDAFGKALQPKQRAKMERLRTWDERFRSKDSQERNLKQAFGEIDRMASALGLPKSTREVAARLYRTAINNGLLPGRCIEGIASASLYAAARKTQSPRSLDELTAVSRVDRLRIQRAYRYLMRELDLGVEPANPETYLHRFHSTLGFDDEVEYVARDLIETAVEHNVHSGKSPLSMAAAALYAAARLTNTETTQAEISDATGVSDVTIRDRYQDILEVQ